MIAADERKRHREEHPVKHRVGDEHADAAGGKGGGPEQAEIDQRRRRLALAPYEAGEQEQPERRRAAAVSPQARHSVMVRSRSASAGISSIAPNASKRRSFATAVVLGTIPSEGRAKQSEGNVDPKDRTPAERPQQRAAQRRAEAEPHRLRRRHDSESLSPPRRTGRVDQENDAAGPDHRAAHALQDAEDDERGQARREAA